MVSEMLQIINKESLIEKAELSRRLNISEELVEDGLKTLEVLGLIDFLDLSKKKSCKMRCAGCSGCGKFISK